VDDLSDNDREEPLRRGWSENWLWLVGGVALGLGALGGWQYWQQTRLQAAEQDEATYLAVLDALSKTDTAGAGKQADGLRAQHPKSPYADQADLALARALVDQRQFDDAARRLRAVADASRDPQLRLIAQSRLARVLAEQGKHNDALKLLDMGKAGAFAPVFHEIRGDVYTAQGDASSARREYDSALAADKTADGALLDTRYVELKRDALASTGTVAAATPAPAASPAPSTGTQP
ncbi:MAG: YfgM family protein, partial [Steroidobacteraceae bacterium]